MSNNGRKISEKIIQRLTKGDLKQLLNYIKTDKELRLEVRQKGDAFVYYRKGVALKIKGLKVDKKYGNVPPTSLATHNPSLYFDQIKKSIDTWLSKNKNRPEFDVQQKIAQENQAKQDNYIILDMEYAFDQSRIEKAEREKKCVFDLIGIERETGKIVFFEVKKGMKATSGKSGIKAHIDDFNAYLFGKHKDRFREKLLQDIKNIVQDKKILGLLTNFDFPKKIKEEIELVFIFEPNKEPEIAAFKKKLEGKCRLLIVEKYDYKLRKGI